MWPLKSLNILSINLKNKVDEIHSDTASWIPGKENNSEFPIPAKGILKELFPIF